MRQLNNLKKRLNSIPVMPWRTLFSDIPLCRLLSELGHEVIATHARKLRLIGESRKKDDRSPVTVACPRYASYDITDWDITIRHNAPLQVQA